MEIEQLSTGNLKQLINLVLEFWEDSDFDEELSNYKNIIDSREESCYLCRQGEDYIGFLHAGTRNDYVEGADHLPVAYIEAIYIKPPFRNNGIARKLMNRAEDWARQKGYKQLASDTELTNAASIDFHKRNGFTEVARVVCFIKEL